MLHWPLGPLISVGVGAAYLWSLYALFFGTAGQPGMHMGFALPATGAGAGDIYLEVASGVTVLILLGRYFEARAKRRAGTALPHCCRWVPRTSRRCGMAMRCAFRPASFWLVTDSWSGPVRRSRPTVWWSPAVPRSTPRC
jgi:hypothetical protein